MVRTKSIGKVRTSQSGVRVTIEEIREQQKLTQREFANLLGVTEKSVQRWENGTRQPSKRHRAAIARRFDVEVSSGSD